MISKPSETLGGFLDDFTAREGIELELMEKGETMTEGTNLVACCGLYCGDCFGYKGKVADLARDLRKELRQAKFDKVAEGILFKEFKHYKECYEALGAMV
jgi:hypothetical protein